MDKLLPLGIAFFDEFGESADDRVQDYARSCLAAQSADLAAEKAVIERHVFGAGERDKEILELRKRLTKQGERLIKAEAELARVRESVRDAIQLASSDAFGCPADVADWLRDELTALKGEEG